MKVLLASPLPEPLCRLIEEREPRLELIRDHSLLPPMRYPSDHQGDPAFLRTPEQQQRFLDLIAGVDVLYGVPDGAGGLAGIVRANPRLSWIQLMSAGGGAMVRAAELTPEELSRVAFTTAAGMHGGPLAEFALFGLLAAAKDLDRLQRLQRRHVWPAEQWLMGQLSEWTVLVVGLGGIGAQVAKVLAGLGTTVIGTARQSGRVVEGVDEIVHPDRIPDVVRRVDAIVLTLPGTQATHHLIGEEVFAQARPGCVVVNVGRGTVIDEVALVRALMNGQVGFAALDVVAQEPLVPTSPLWEFDNVIISPHTASNDRGEDERIAELFIDNASRLLDSRPLRNRVDLAEYY